MAVAQTFYIFNSGASPQTGVGDGEGNWLRVKRDPEGAGRGVDVTDEVINIVITGSLNSATIKIKTANELSSPMVSANAQNPRDDGTMIDVSFTTTGSFLLTLPSGTYFTAEISGEGSPLPAIVMSARGEIELA